VTQKMPALLHWLHFGFNINELVSAGKNPPALRACTNLDKDPRR
jgi:hypothetical protein